MKDKKFRVMLTLLAIWLALFIAGLFKDVNPRLEIIVLLICIGWFAYWTISTIVGSIGKKPSSNNLGDHLVGKCDCSSHKQQNAEKPQNPEK